MGLFSRKKVGYFTDFKNKNYEKILRKLNVNFILINGDSGIRLRNKGYDAEFRKKARENLFKFKQEKINKIIVSSPLTFKAFSLYKEILPDFDIEIDFISSVILDKASKLNIDEEKNKIGFHSCCFLDDNLKNQEIKILENLNYEVEEIGECFCQLDNKEIEEKLKNNFIKEIKEKKIEKLVVNCKDCYGKLNDIVSVRDFSDAVIEAFGFL